MFITGVLFIVMYCCLFAFPDKRHVVAMVGALLFILCNQITIAEAAIAVDYNVLLMIAGSMGLVHFFIESKMPARIADMVLSKIHSACLVIVVLALLTGVISAFIDNVATVLMMAPIALTIAERLKVSPIPVIIVVAVSSNLQGAATLVGDTTSLLLAGAANLDFFDFFIYNGRPSIFFVVEAGAITSAIVLWLLFRKYTGIVEETEYTEVTDYAPTIAITAMLLLLIAASFISNKPSITNGIICMTLYVVLAIYETWKMKINQFAISAKAIDYSTLLVLCGVFIAVSAVEKSGLLAFVANELARIGGGNLFLVYTVIVWMSVLISAFIDNIPYVAVMLPVVASLSTSLQVNPTILYFGLLIGSTLGGNLTPVGASANITAIGILRKAGYSVSNTDFLKIGIPFTFTAIVTGYVVLWMLWA